MVVAVFRFRGDIKAIRAKESRTTGSTMSHSLEASLVFNDSLAANETLAALGKQGQFAVAEVLNAHQKRFAYWSWDPEDNTDTLGALVSRWLFPVPVAQPIVHNGTVIGEISSYRTRQPYQPLYLAVAGCPDRLHSVCFCRCAHHYTFPASRHGYGDAHNTDVVHDVRANRNFSRRVTEGRIEEFHQFGEDFNSLLDEMEEWQLKLQAKLNAQLLRTAMHDPLTGLANRAAFRNSIAALMNDSSAKGKLGPAFPRWG